MYIRVCETYCRMNDEAFYCKPPHSCNHLYVMIKRIRMVFKLKKTLRTCDWFYFLSHQIVFISIYRITANLSKYPYCIFIIYL